MKVPALSIKPEKAEAQFGWLARFAGHDMPASSVLMQHKVNWKPTGPGRPEPADGAPVAARRHRGNLLEWAHISGFFLLHDTPIKSDVSFKKSLT